VSYFSTVLPVQQHRLGKKHSILISGYLTGFFPLPRLEQCS